MKRIFRLLFLGLFSILATSCMGTVINMVASHMPNLMLATPDGTSRMVWDFKAQKMVVDDPETLEVKKIWEDAAASSVKSFAFSLDSRYMTFVSEDKIKIWDFKKNLMHRVLEPEGEPWSAVFSADNRYVASTERKGLYFYVSIWDLDWGNLLWREKTSINFPQSISFTKNSKQVAVGGFEYIEIFSVGTGRSVRTLDLGKKGKADSVKYSPSGRYIAAGIKQENPEVRVWDISSGEPKIKCQLLGHTNRIVGEGIVFNYNEKYLATGAADMFAKEEDAAKRFEAIIWDLDSCRKVRSIQEFVAIGAGPDGRFFAWDKDLNKMKTYFWGGEWIHDITGRNMFNNINELVSNLADGIDGTKKPLIAITDFAPIGKSPTTLEKFLSEEFITRMTLTQKFRVVERSLLDKVLAELRLNVSDLVDPEKAVQAGKLLGANYLLVGTVTDEKFGFKINARIINTETAEVFKASSTTIVKDPMIRSLMEERT